MTWKHFFSGSLHRLAFSSTKCRSKHLLLLTSYTSYQKAYCPYLPISSIHAQRHLFYFHPTLLWCDVSLLGIYPRQSDREMSAFEAHVRANLKKSFCCIKILLFRIL